MKASWLAASLLAAAGSATASAQDAGKHDAFAGYSMLAADGDRWQGWHAALGLGLSGRLSLVLDASSHQADVEGTDVSALSLMAGPRLTFGGGRLRPFLHVIGGVVRTKAGVGVFEVDISESTTGFGGAAGGGVDLGLGGRWAARLTGDYRMVRIDDETVSDPRFSAGVVYRFGAE